MPPSDANSDSSQPPQKSVLEYATPVAPFFNPAMVVALTCATACLVSFGLLAASGSAYAGMLLVISAFSGLISAGIARSRAKRNGVSTAAATTLAVCLGLLLVSLLAVVLVPQGRPRASANRIKCKNNLRQIGNAILAYSQKHQGGLPPSINEIAENLLADEFLPEVLVCPSSNDEKSPGATTRQVIQDIHSKPGFCSYVYIGSGLKTPVSPQHILAYEPLNNHQRQGTHVVYGDSHAEWLSGAEAKHVLSELAAGHNPPRPRASRADP